MEGGEYVSWDEIDGFLSRRGRPVELDEGEIDFRMEKVKRLGEIGAMKGVFEYVDVKKFHSKSEESLKN